VSVETDLRVLLASLRPYLQPGRFVFCRLPGSRYGDHASLEPLAAFQEAEGLTLVLPLERADEAGCQHDTVFRCLTLGVRSSLQAVGLTAAVASCLTERGISANVIAACEHDHLFVPEPLANEALAHLDDLSARHRTGR
jgi:hypothetical protein